MNEPEPLEDGIPFEVDGTAWIARPAGAGAAGAGTLGLAAIEAVHFFRPGESRPRFEALLARGRFASLFPAELTDLLRTATAVPPLS